VRAASRPAARSIVLSAVGAPAHGRRRPCGDDRPFSSPLNATPGPKTRQAKPDFPFFRTRADPGPSTATEAVVYSRILGRTDGLPSSTWIEALDYVLDAVWGIGRADRLAIRVVDSENARHGQWTRSCEAAAPGVTRGRGRFLTGLNTVWPVKPVKTRQTSSKMRTTRSVTKCLVL
jgi:hypothetical protein